MTNEGRLPDGTLEFDKARIIDIRTSSHEEASELYSFLFSFVPKERKLVGADEVLVESEEREKLIENLGLGFAGVANVRGEGTWLEVEEALSALRIGEEDGDLDFAFDTWTGSPGEFNHLREGRP